MVPPTALEPDDLQAALGLAEAEPIISEDEPLLAEPDEGAEGLLSRLPSNLPVLLGILCLCAVGGGVGVGLIGFGLIRRRRDKTA